MCSCTCPWVTLRAPICSVTPANAAESSTRYKRTQCERSAPYVALGAEAPLAHHVGIARCHVRSAFVVWARPRQNYLVLVHSVRAPGALKVPKACMRPTRSARVLTMNQTPTGVDKGSPPRPPVFLHPEVVEVRAILVEDLMCRLDPALVVPHHDVRVQGV